MVNISATEREPKEFRLKEGTELKLACIHDQLIQIMIYWSNSYLHNHWIVHGISDRMDVSSL